MIYAVIERAVVAVVKGYGEPTLTSTYGEQYLGYRRIVPAWSPWRQRPGRTG